VKKTIFIFSAFIVALLALFQISKYSYVSGDASIETIIAAIAVIFLFIGFNINGKVSEKVSPSSNYTINTKNIEELGISKREYEVLIEISKGSSNKEIANKLYVTESTIKTHVSNVLVKLDVKRRTQAIKKAKDLQIISI
jgi:DNA-binding NarL/FixJ family response regulator